MVLAQSLSWSDFSVNMSARSQYLPKTDDKTSMLGIYRDLAVRMVRILQSNKEHARVLPWQLDSIRC